MRERKCFKVQKTNTDKSYNKFNQAWKIDLEKEQQQELGGGNDTLYSSSLSPAAEATCCSCAGFCFLNIRCRSTKMFADSGEVCSNTARPPYLWAHNNLLIRNVFNKQSSQAEGVQVDHVPGSAGHVVSVHLLLRREQAESLAAVECRDPDIVREVVLGVHHL